MNTLLNFKNLNKIEAENGVKGSGAKCNGRNGNDVIVKVPIGTMIRDFETNKLLVDMNVPNRKSCTT